MKFYVFVPGDHKVGIWDGSAIVEVKDNFRWDDGMVQDFKDYLADFYDIGKDGAVLTEEEYILSQKKINDMEEEYLQDHIETMAESWIEKRYEAFLNWFHNDDFESRQEIYTDLARWQNSDEGYAYEAADLVRRWIDSGRAFDVAKSLPDKYKNVGWKQ